MIIEYNQICIERMKTLNKNFKYFIQPNLFLFTLQNLMQNFNNVYISKKISIILFILEFFIS